MLQLLAEHSSFFVPLLIRNISLNLIFISRCMYFALWAHSLLWCHLFLSFLRERLGQ